MDFSFIKTKMIDMDKSVKSKDGWLAYMKTFGNARGDFSQTKDLHLCHNQDLLATTTVVDKSEHPIFKLILHMSDTNKKDYTFESNFDIENKKKLKKEFIEQYYEEYKKLTKEEVKRWNADTTNTRKIYSKAELLQNNINFDKFLNILIYNLDKHDEPPAEDDSAKGKKSH